MLLLIAFFPANIWGFWYGETSFRNRVIPQFFLPRKIPSNHRFWGGFWNVETTTKLTKTGFGRWAEGFRAFRASLLVMGHHAGPMGITRIQLTSCFESTLPWTNRQREESAASAGHGGLAICLLELLAAGIHWFAIYRRQRWWNAALFGHNFHDFLLCFMRGVPKIPYRCCPTFLMIFTIIVLAGWTEHVEHFFVVFFLVIALDYFACFQKTWLGSTPQPVTVGKKGLGWDSLLNV